MRSPSIAMPACILVIEDDPALGAQIREQLTRAGYRTEWWQKGKLIGEQAAKELSLVVLDLMLPGLYGMDVLKELRHYSDVPVLVLSARNEKEDKVRALKLGADDYLTKPFWPEELLARVSARLRRPRIEQVDRLVAGPLEMRPGEHQALVSGQAVALTPLEAELLNALLRRVGSAVSRRWLVENVLASNSDNAERTLDVHISRLRKKLGQDGLIETVWGIGYRIDGGGAA